MVPGTGANTDPRMGHGWTVDRVGALELPSVIDRGGRRCPFSFVPQSQHRFPSPPISSSPRPPPPPTGRPPPCIPRGTRRCSSSRRSTQAASTPPRPSPSWSATGGDRGGGISASLGPMEPEIILRPNFPVFVAFFLLKIHRISHKFSTFRCYFTTDSENSVTKIPYFFAQNNCILHSNFSPIQIKLGNFFL